MTAFTGSLRIQNDEATEALNRIAQLAFGVPCVEKIAVVPVQKSTITVREEAVHA